MTDKQRKAIEVIKSECYVLPFLDGDRATLINSALDMAIEAIKAQRTGKWIEKSINEWSRKVFCSECGCTAPFEHVSNGDIYSAGGYGVNNKTKFCPNCGARMIESEDKNGI